MRNKHLVFMVCLLAVLAVTLTVLPTTAQAASVSDLTYTISDGAVTIQSISAYGTGSLTIPETIEGYPVTTIGYMAFYRSNLSSVTIPNTVKTISSKAFEQSYSLTTVTMGNGVTSIGNNAFETSGVKNVYYKGTQAQWNAISIGTGNSRLTNATIHFPDHFDHPACGTVCTHEQTHEMTAATKWTGGTMYNADYYLGGDLTLSKDITVKNTALLCLNGYKLTFAEEYGFVIEEGAALEICDCQGTGEVARGPRTSNGDTSIISNRGTLTLYGGKYCLDGEGVSIYNAATLDIYGGTYGINLSNYKTATIYQATFAMENVSYVREAIGNSSRATLTIYDCTVRAKGGAIKNSGTAKVYGGTYALTDTDKMYFRSSIYNEGRMDLENVTVSALWGYGIHNTANTNSTGVLTIKNSTVTLADTTRGAAVYNQSSAMIYSGTFHGYIGLCNGTRWAGSTKNGGNCNINGGTFTGVLCGVHNSGNSYTEYVNGVATRRYSKATMTINYAPKISKLLLDYPDALTFYYTGTTPMDLAVNPEEFAVGGVVWLNGPNKLSDANLVTEGYFLIYDSQKDEVVLSDDHCGAQGDNLRWKLTKDGVLTIYGTGAMKNFDFSSYQPWYDYKTKISIKQVVIEPGVTTIGTSAFAYIKELTQIVIPEGVTKIESWSFEGCEALNDIWLPASLESIASNIFIGCESVPENIYYAGCIHQWNQISGAKNLSVTPITQPNTNTDDGDCTTAVICSVCGEADVPARQTHTGGTANCTTLAQCEVCQLSYGTYRHSIQSVEAQTPSCTNIGWEAYETCGNCSYSTYVEMPALPHEYEASFDWSETHAECLVTLSCGCGKRVVAEATVSVDNTDPTQTAHKATMEYNEQNFADVLTCQNHQVQFLNWNGTIIETRYYHPGAMVTAPADPVKPTDHIASYRFAGWDKEIVACTGDATYTATYSPDYIDYTVRFVNEDGTELSKTVYHWGDAVTAPADPAKASDHMANYRFAGWDKEIVACAGDATYTATYTPEYIAYTVRFVNDDGTELSKAVYHWGDSVTVPASPKKATDQLASYRFAGWDKTVTVCQGNATYTATYTAEYIEYFIRFVDEDGTELSRTAYHWGDEVIPPAAPTKEADQVGSYRFAGWNKTVVNCEGPATYTATYVTEYTDYAVRFVDADGKEITTVTCHWGDKVTPPADPAKASDESYTYRFIGWDKEIVVCAGDATYTATYEATYINYTVTFQYEDGTIIAQYALHYGDAVTAPQVSAVPEELGERYAFAGWDKEITVCQGNSVYIATFAKERIPGDVNDDGEVTTDDAVYLLLYVMFGQEDYPVEEGMSLDFDGNSTVDTDDAVYLLLHVMFGKEDYPLTV